MHVIAICRGACAQSTQHCSTRVQRRIIDEAGIPPPPPPPPPKMPLAAAATAAVARCPPPGACPDNTCP